SSIDADQTQIVADTAPVAHQAARGYEIAIDQDRRDAVVDRKRCELFAPTLKIRILSYDKSAGPQLEHFQEHLIEVAFTGGINKMEIKPQGAGRVLEFIRRKGIAWIDQDRETGCRGDRFVQQLEPLR